VLILIEFKMFRINTYASVDSKPDAWAGLHFRQGVGTKCPPGHLNLPRDSMTEGLSRVKEKPGRRKGGVEAGNQGKQAGYGCYKKT
jgi:hypothetical protein